MYNLVLRGEQSLSLVERKEGSHAVSLWGKRLI